MSVRILRFANRKLPALIVTDEYIYLLHPDTNKEETLRWEEIELFRKRKGLGIENVEIKLFSNDTIKNLPWVKRKWKSRLLHRLFNIDVLNSSNANIVNSLDWHSQLFFLNQQSTLPAHLL
ncbi:hypothetical protein [Mucilaginibacter gracilis]|nr:hypothetical protein [Mucilaginibacter gracilis]